MQLRPSKPPFRMFVYLSRRLYLIISARYGLESRGRQGAALITLDDSRRSIIIPNIKWRDYFKRNHKAWLEFARDTLGYSIQAHDLILVRGHMKTNNRWVAVVTGGKGKFSVIVNSSDVEPKVTTDAPHDEFLTAWRTGFSYDALAGKKVRDLQRATGALNPEQPDEERHHCLFLSYYHMKRRALFPTRITAAAERKDAGSREGEGGEVVYVLPWSSPGTKVSHKYINNP